MPAFSSGSRWRCVEKFRARTCFLDVETTGLYRGFSEVTVVGLHQAAETRTLVRGQDLSRAALREALADVELLVTFNGKRFDVPFFESEFGLSIDLLHLDLLYPCRRLGWTGGLKEIERTVGIERERPDLSGRDAVRLWRTYEAGDGAALETLLAYNREETVHLERLLELVVERLEAEIFRSVVGWTD